MQAPNKRPPPKKSGGGGLLDAIKDFSAKGKLRRAKARKPSKKIPVEEKKIRSAGSELRALREAFSDDEDSDTASSEWSESD